MKTFRRALVASAVALACSAGTASAQFSANYVFGDSLSDAGQFGSRFTTNPGLTAPMYVGERFGLTTSPSFTGGTAYAVGGARVNTTNPGTPSTVPYQTVAQQVTAYLQTGPADPSALYQISGGGNDLLAYAQAFLAGQITQAQLQGGVIQAAADLATQVGRLQAAGAQNIVLLGLPDPGKSPFATTPALGAQLTQLGDLFNTTLNAGLAAGNLRVINFNYAGVQREVLANPAAYGFTNTTGLACTTASTAQCTSSTLAAPNANMTWVFADAIHPTTGFHLLVASAVASMIEGPQQAATLTEGPLAVEQAMFRAVDARMWSGLDTPYAAKGVNVWASYDYANPDIDVGLVSGDANLSTLSVGGDVRINPHLMAGAAAHFSRYDASYSGGGHELDEVSATIYGGWGSGPWYVGGSLVIGTLDYSDVSRTYDLGALSRTGSGDTSGTHWGLRALGGYWMKHSNVLHGPFAKLVYQDVSVNGFSEGGATATTLRYGAQDRESLIGSLGWQAQGTWGAVRPFGRVTWEYEFKDDARSVTASPAVGGSYSIGVGAPDDNWFLFNFGASMDFGQPSASYGRLSGYLMGTATAAKDDGDSWAITVGLRLPM